MTTFTCILFGAFSLQLASKGIISGRFENTSHSRIIYIGKYFSYPGKIFGYKNVSAFIYNFQFTRISALILLSYDVRFAIFTLANAIHLMCARLRRKIL